jgi:hypothetical protein
MKVACLSEWFDRPDKTSNFLDRLNTKDFNFPKKSIHQASNLSVPIMMYGTCPFSIELTGRSKRLF